MHGLNWYCLVGWRTRSQEVRFPPCLLAEELTNITPDCVWLMGLHALPPGWPWANWVVPECHQKEGLANDVWVWYFASREPWEACSKSAKHIIIIIICRSWLTSSVQFSSHMFRHKWSWLPPGWDTEDDNLRSMAAINFPLTNTSEGNCLV